MVLGMDKKTVKKIGRILSSFFWVWVARAVANGGHCHAN
jgi:hypothetical protein